MVHGELDDFDEYDDFEEGKPAVEIDYDSMSVGNVGS